MEIQSGRYMYGTKLSPKEGIRYSRASTLDLFRSREEALRYREGLLEAWGVGPAAQQFRNFAAVFGGGTPSVS